jgi:hypothetical protein
MKLFATTCFLISVLFGFSQSDVIVLSDYEDGVAPAILNGQYGVVNPKGDWLLKPELQKISNYQNGSYIGLTEGKYVIFDSKGKVKNQYKYDSIVYTKWQDEILLYRNIKISVLFKSGVVTEPKYDEFQFGWGIDHGLIIDEDGSIKYDAFLKGGKALEGLLKSINSSEYKRNCIQSSANGKVGFMDTLQVEIIPAKYDEIILKKTREDKSGLSSLYYIGRTDSKSVSEKPEFTFDIYNFRKELLIQDATYYSNEGEMRFGEEQLIFGVDEKFGIIYQDRVLIKPLYDQISIANNIFVLELNNRFELMNCDTTICVADSINWFMSSYLEDSWDDDGEPFLDEVKTMYSFNYFVVKNGNEVVVWDVNTKNKIAIGNGFNLNDVKIINGGDAAYMDDGSYSVDEYYYDDDYEYQEENHLFTSFEIVNNLRNIGRVNIEGQRIPVKYDSIFEHEEFTLCRIKDVVDIYNKNYTLRESVVGEVIKGSDFFDKYTNCYPVPFIIKSNEKLGLISQGMVVVAPSYDKLESRSNGSFIGISNSTGYYVFDGKLLDHPFEYSPTIYDYRLYSDNRIDFFTLDGIKKYPFATEFEIVKSIESNKYGLMVLEGSNVLEHWAIEPNYDSLVSTTGNYYIGYDSKNISLLNYVGEELIKVESAGGSIVDWSKNLRGLPIFSVRNNAEKYFFDAEFKNVFPNATIAEVAFIDYETDEISDVMILKGPKTYFLYDRVNGEKISEEYTEMRYSYSEEHDVLIVKKGRKKGVITTTGKVLLPIKFSDITDYSYNFENVFIIKKGKKIGLMHGVHGEIFKPIKGIVDTSFSSVNRTSNVFVRETIEGKYELKDIYGNTIFENPVEQYKQRTYGGSMIVGVNSSKMHVAQLKRGELLPNPSWKGYTVKAVVGEDVYVIQESKLYKIKAGMPDLTLVQEGSYLVKSEYMSVKWSGGKFYVVGLDDSAPVGTLAADSVFLEYEVGYNILYFVKGEWLFFDGIITQNFIEEWGK